MCFEDYDILRDQFNSFAKGENREMIGTKLAFMKFCL